MKKFLVYFASGCFGALCSSLLMWLGGDLGFSKKMGVAIAPVLTAQWLYPKIIWGGIWAELFLIPILKGKILTRGMLFSLAPTSVQLFYFLPYREYKGIAGMELGMLTPLWIIIFNLIWGTITALMIRLSR